MPATVIPFRRPTQPHDPALAAALSELTELGLAVARAASRLAYVETAAADALAAAAVSTARALSTVPGSLEQARSIGQDADLSEAARDAAVARVAAITECFNKAARAVRRTVALQARLAAGHPVAEAPPPGAAPQHRSTPRPRPAADLADSPDRPEDGDELGARTDEEVLRAIRRDAAAAAANVALLTEDPPVPGRMVPGRVGFRPTQPALTVPPAPLPDDRPATPAPRPVPDT